MFLDKIKQLFSKQETVILWDVDGVFNPFLANDLDDPKYTKVEEPYLSWHLNIEEHSKWLKELNKLATFYYASSWNERSNTISKQFGLPDYDYIYLEQPLEHNGTWKLDTIKEWALDHPKKRIIWVDDEVTEDAKQWAKDRGNTLLIKINDDEGLQYRHVEEIKSYIRQPLD